jgi:hypothetical protein
VARRNRTCLVGRRDAGHDIDLQRPPFGDHAELITAVIV